ncbi:MULTISPECIES: hypothetical protein [Burkholderia]|jgi:hypothetical protein|uniref:Uncharacterized protein n=2 Tax=Burkholderia contaminans TaxID=488447 RepID=A0AAP1VG21_9BURK|nr:MULTISPECIES: hypothetical protein [Burkholderia]EKS9800597.1 hypothetical protein [Burkholderia cepacia]EKS9807820.1 hypothetical protein [Burkholderia cepacia]EKS9815420.1 hypothetical protein [Burkholderia cepacia]EKS9821945.1 hypothetical protein [Burkholderia cepacia]EKS9829570.1 hypothetical protein [Burkholderia cepacia]
MERTYGIDGFTRRRFLCALAALAGYYGGPAAGASEDRSNGRYQIYVDDVVPRQGVDTRVAFGDAIHRLVAAGVIVPDKYRAVIGAKARLPDWVEHLFVGPSSSPIVFSAENAPYLLHLLWPLGLATRARFNEHSPMRTVRLPSFASTGGWTLGQASNGYVYFDRIDTMRLTPAQEAIALEVATNTYRPCCDNSTFYQDCNHGSALLGMIELAASQGASADLVFRIARVANSYWFTSQYAMTSMVFTHLRQQAWHTVSPRLVLGQDYSSLSGWQRNVADVLERKKVSGPLPQQASASCGMPGDNAARLAAPHIVRRE